MFVAQLDVGLPNTVFMGLYEVCIAIFGFRYAFRKQSSSPVLEYRPVSGQQQTM